MSKIDASYLPELVAEYRKSVASGEALEETDLRAVLGIAGIKIKNDL